MEKYTKTIIAPLKKNTKKEGKLSIALIAHDGKKAEMLSFVKENENFFQGIHYYCYQSHWRVN
jgi:hypothetical protein